MKSLLRRQRLTVLTGLLLGWAMARGAAPLYGQEAAAPKPVRPQSLTHGLEFQSREKSYQSGLANAKDVDQRRDALRQLAWLYEDVGDLAHAASYHQRILQDLEKGAADVVDLAEQRTSLAAIRLQQGDFTAADALLNRTLAELEKSRLSQSKWYADALEREAEVHLHLGDYEQALPRYRKALAIRKRLARRPTRDYASAVHNLGLVYQRLGRLADAEPLLEEDRDVTRQLVGSGHPDYAHSLDTLALLYTYQGKHDQAEPLFRQARDIFTARLGSRSRSLARVLDNYGYLSMRAGDYPQARELLEAAVAMRKELLGSLHPDYGDAMFDLATLYFLMGDTVRAAAAAEESLQLAQRMRDLVAALQSEQQQLATAATLRKRLDLFLSLGARGAIPVERTHAAVLAWKGAVLVRQRWLRGLRHAGDAPAQRIAGQLEATARRLATLALAAPEPAMVPRWRQQVRDLADEKERLEAEWARHSAALRTQRTEGEPSAGQLSQALPEKTVLFDFLEYHRCDRPVPAKGLPKLTLHLVVFVARRGTATKLVDLGPAKPLEGLIDRWRTAVQQPGSPDSEALAIALYDALWRPLEGNLDGVTTVLISPDGALTGMAWPALPGTQPGRFLVEDAAVAVLPVPQMLPEIVADAPAAGVASPSLLLVGEVDFDGQSGRGLREAASRSAPRALRSGLQTWRALPATREEVVAIRDSFEQAFPDGEVRALRRSLATESALRRETPRFNHLHLATHGYFATPQSHPETVLPDRAFSSLAIPGLDTIDPGLLSGLALAGANLPPAPEQDDGILTALEVAGLDLRQVSLATLSACETGLGRVAGGEGVLGLQRAFQVAGARTVVASLWAVDDEQTRKLMVRFYENLWERRLGRLESLRQAQLWMLREGPRRDVRIRSPTATKDPKASPPCYWAAFVLSGDWR